MEIGRVSKILDDNGKVKYRQVYITKGVELAQGDTLYLNDIEESLAKKVEFKLITEQEKAERLTQIRENDRKFNRETTHVLRVAKKKDNGSGDTL
jgi:hypothetical protein